MSKSREGGASGKRPLEETLIEAREDAEADLQDAVALAGTPGGGSMAVWHAGQAAEKLLRVLALSAGRQVPVLWDITKVFEAVRDLPGAADLAEAVATIAQALKERASEARLKPQTLRGTIEAARVVRRGVFQALGLEVPPDTPFEVGFPVSEVATHERRPDVRGVGERPAAVPSGTRMRDGRSDADRRTSYVRVFLLCERCGVRIPRTQQTAHGRVPCPLCGRAMTRAT